MPPNTARSVELQIIIWFLEAGWELFTLVADIGSDMVVRHPQTRELLAIQVKHKQPGSLNEGLLAVHYQESAMFIDRMKHKIIGRSDLCSNRRQKKC